jgi:hypothetical protein
MMKGSATSQAFTTKNACKQEPAIFKIASCGYRERICRTNIRWEKAHWLISIEYSKSNSNSGSTVMKYPKSKERAGSLPVEIHFLG